MWKYNHISIQHVQCSVRNKAFPVVWDNQTLWQTINSYHEAERTTNFWEGYFHINTLLFKGIYKSSKWLSELKILITVVISTCWKTNVLESCRNKVGRSYLLLADNRKFQQTTWKSDLVVRWTTSFLTLISNDAMWCVNCYLILQVLTVTRNISQCEIITAIVVRILTLRTLMSTTVDILCFY